MHDSSPRVTCRILDTGYCLASEHHMIRGGARRTVECHSIVALIRHPVHGYTLWDAGYAPRVVEATRRFPFRIYSWATPMRLRPELAAAAQLARLGVEPRDVRRIVLSHFHADHVGGLRDFPTSEFVATRAAWEDTSRRSGVRALLRAVVPALLPDDFERRAQLLPEFTGPDDELLGRVHDLFGDGSVLLVPLPGHARGQIGLLARTETGPLLLAADACWLSDSIRLNRPPSLLARIIVDDHAQLLATLARLHRFARARPEVAIVPSHCPEAFRRHVVAAAP